MTHLLFRVAVGDSPRVIVQDKDDVDKWWLCVLLPDGTCAHVPHEIGALQVEAGSPKFGVLRLAPFKSARYVMVDDQVSNGSKVIALFTSEDTNGRITVENRISVRNTAGEVETVEDWEPQDAEQIAPSSKWSIRAPLLSSLAKFPTPSIDTKQLRQQGWDEFINPMTMERAPPTQKEADDLIVARVANGQQIPPPTRFLLAWIAALLPTRVDGAHRRGQVLHAMVTLAALPNSAPLLAETLRLLVGPVPMTNMRGVYQAIDQYNLPIVIDNSGGISVSSTRWRWESSSPC